MQRSSQEKLGRSSLDGSAVGVASDGVAEQLLGLLKLSVFISLGTVNQILSRKNSVIERAIGPDQIGRDQYGTNSHTRKSHHLDSIYRPRQRPKLHMR